MNASVKIWRNYFNIGEMKSISEIFVKNISLNIGKDLAKNIIKTDISGDNNIEEMFFQNLKINSLVQDIKTKIGTDLYNYSNKIVLKFDRFNKYILIKKTFLCDDSNLYTQSSDKLILVNENGDVL